MHSPRSTRGITFKTAYSNGLPTNLLQGFGPPARLFEAARQELDVSTTHRLGVGEPGLVFQPLLGYQVDDLAQGLVRELGNHRGVGFGYGSGEVQQHVVAGGRERTLARG